MVVAGRLVVYAVGERDVSVDVLKALDLLEKDAKPTSSELAELVLELSGASALDLEVGARGRDGNMEPLPMLAATIQHLRIRHGSEVELSVLFVLTDQSDDDEVDQFHKDRDTLPFLPVLQSWGEANGVEVLDPVVSRQPASRTYALDTLLNELSERVRDLNPEAVTVVVGPSTPAHHLTLTLLLADGLVGVRDVEYVELLEIRPNPKDRTIPPFTDVVPLDMPRLVDGPTTRQAALRRLRDFQPAQALDVASSFESAFDDEWMERLRTLVTRIERHDPVDHPIAQVADLVDRLELGALSTAPPWQQLFELAVLIVEILPNAWLERYTELHPSTTTLDIPENEATIIQGRSGVSVGRGFEARLLLASAAPLIHRMHDKPDEFVTPLEQDRFTGEEGRSLLWQAWWKELKQLRNDLAHTYMGVASIGAAAILRRATVATNERIKSLCGPVVTREVEEFAAQALLLDEASIWFEKGFTDTSGNIDWTPVVKSVATLDAAKVRRAALLEAADRIELFGKLKPRTRQKWFGNPRLPAVVDAVVSGQVSPSILYIFGLMKQGTETEKLKEFIAGSEAALWFRALTAPGNSLCLTNQRGSARSVEDEALWINEPGLDPDPRDSAGRVGSSPLRETMRRFLRAEEDPDFVLAETNPLIDECEELADQLQNATGRAVTAP